MHLIDKAMGIFGLEVVLPEHQYGLFMYFFNLRFSEAFSFCFKEHVAQLGRLDHRKEDLETALQLSGKVGDIFDLLFAFHALFEQRHHYIFLLLA